MSNFIKNVWSQIIPCDVVKEILCELVILKGNKNIQMVGFSILS